MRSRFERSRLIRWVLMVLPIVLGLLTSSSIAAQIASTSTLSLKTVDAQSGSAIGGVQVVVVGVGSRVTDSGGVARFEVLRLDSATIVARKIGYARSMIAVSLRDSTTITVRLQKLANLPSVTVREDGVAQIFFTSFEPLGSSSGVLPQQRQAAPSLQTRTSNAGSHNSSPTSLRDSESPSRIALRTSTAWR
jgi:hypothetical protein